MRFTARRRSRPTTSLALRSQHQAQERASAIVTPSRPATTASSALRVRCAAASSFSASSAADVGASSRWCRSRGSSGSARDDVRRLGEQSPLQRRQADLVLHPALEIGLGGDPQVEVGVEHADPGLDRSSSVFCSSTSCGWISTLNRRDAREELQQHRPSEISFSGRSNTGSQTTRISALELVDARVGRHPARLDVRGRDAVVVAAEEGEEILREIALVLLGERAHDPEIDGDVLAVVRRIDGDEDVPRMHVGVEVGVAEHLREEELDAGARQPLQVDAGFDAACPPARSGCRSSAPSPSPRWRRSPSAPPAPAAAANTGNCGAAASSWPPRASGRARRASVFSNSATTSRGRRRRPSDHSFSIERRAGVHAGRCPFRSRRRCPGRSTLTATGVPSCSVAKCTCATDALATGVRSNAWNTWSTGLP